MRKVLMASALALSIAVPAAAQSGQEPQQQQQQQKPQQQQERQVGTAGAGAATVEMVMDNPNQWYDKNVTLTAQVAEVLSQRAFRLQEKGMADADDQLLVILQKPGQQRLSDDARVRVTGKVHRFNRANIEREYNITNWSDFGLDESALGKYNDKPVLVATNVEMAQAAK